MPAGIKLTNSYKRAFGRVFDATPKAVFAAVAFSLSFRDVEQKGELEAVSAFMHEWEVLNQNGIVPQKPCWKDFNDWKGAAHGQA